MDAAQRARLRAQAEKARDALGPPVYGSTVLALLDALDSAERERDEAHETTLQQRIELAALRAFAAAIMDDWPDLGTLDGFDVQDEAIRCGLLVRATPDPTEPCGENCQCAEVNGPEDWADGVICYRPTDVLRRARGD